ncbi:hypothetical protein GCM10011506_37020 [Marivirga lumbricoides]|uniref:Uncharacterized protein n=2 Tax=Marivirga lumbricoides TaxID=1046115 RepID=A0ABQ1MXF3_9BACT|nr:hypothetical protein GCM10011506_37020 [Marivirga lumbricoides]
MEEVKDITIEEVKAAFNARKTQNINSRTSTDNSVDIVWDLAIYKELEVGDVLFFPTKSNIGEEGKRYVSSGEGTKRFPVDYTSFGRAYKDEAGEVVLEYVMPVPTENTAEFTGYFLVSDWGDEAKRMLIYENGILIEESKVTQQPNHNEENNRSMSGCVQYDYWFCVDVHIDGELRSSKCTHDYTEIVCTDPLPIAGQDPGTGSETGGTGGGGPSDPDNPNSLCRHPFIEGMWVDCDAVICSENYLADENGECVPDCEPGMVPDGNGNCIIDCGPNLVPDGDGDCVADLANALTAVGRGNVNNPYNGMKATDNNGLVYTYNSELGAWLLPELQTLKENGFEIQLYDDTNYEEGGVLATMTAVALVEPTPIGEIIVLGYVVYIYWSSVHEFAEADDLEFPNEACLDFFEECTFQNDVNNTQFNCASCLRDCYETKIGQWPFAKCAIGY